MPLETIIRPFQTRAITPPRLAPTAAPGDIGDPVELEFGKGGGTHLLNGGANLTITYYSIKRPTEKTTSSSTTTTNISKSTNPAPTRSGNYPEYTPPTYQYPSVLNPGSQVE